MSVSAEEGSRVHQAMAERYGAAPVVEYPEHTKLDKVKDQSQAVGEFVEWLQDEKGIVLARYGSDDDMTVVGNVRKLLAEFFEIDEAKLEEEKLAMLAALRARPVTP